NFGIGIGAVIGGIFISRFDISFAPCLSFFIIQFFLAFAIIVKDDNKLYNQVERKARDVYDTQNHHIYWTRVSVHIFNELLRTGKYRIYFYKRFDSSRFAYSA